MHSFSCASSKRTPTCSPIFFRTSAFSRKWRCVRSMGSSTMARRRARCPPRYLRTTIPRFRSSRIGGHSSAVDLPPKRTLAPADPQEEGCRFNGAAACQAFRPKLVEDASRKWFRTHLCSRSLESSVQPLANRQTRAARPRPPTRAKAPLRPSPKPRTRSAKPELLRTRLSTTPTLRRAAVLSPSTWERRMVPQAESLRI
mmetsp:Transcript_82928/g.231267  ORF Transcript_82928/g.231267 Transcript_82928/m.231267 type:complete len:200 (-) Transcript_82928:206-805(-)